MKRRIIDGEVDFFPGVWNNISNGGSYPFDAHSTHNLVLLPFAYGDLGVFTQRERFVKVCFVQIRVLERRCIKRWTANG